MSKERELLEKILNTGWLNHELSCEVEAILAQPEQEQEPVAWKVIDGTNGEFMFSRVKPMERNYKFDVVIPLYTAPPKREPLTRQQISEGNQSMFNATRDAFVKGVKFAEKAHGIGGEE